MGTQTLLRDFEVAYNKCYKTVTTATGAVTGNYEKVVALDGKVVWYDVNADTQSGVAPVPAAGDLLIECDAVLKVETWCDDTLGDGTTVVEFLRVYLYQLGATTPYFTGDFEEDGVTPYVISGAANVKKCGGEAEITLQPTCATATNGAPVTIPMGVNSFSITNIGENADACVFADIALSGGMTYAMPAALGTYSDSVEEDQDGLFTADVIVTPAAGHSAVVCWKL